MDFGFELTVILLMLGLNAVFAAYEMSLASISLSRLEALAEKGAAGARAALEMKGNMAGSLAVIQLGITLVGAIAAATGGAGVEETLVPFLANKFLISLTAAEVIALVVLVIPLSVITIVFAELFPKMFALQNKEWVCLRLSPPMKILSRVAFPLVAFFEWAVKKLMGGIRFGKSAGKKSQEQPELHELKAAAQLARASRLIGPREEKIVLAAAQLSQRKVEATMVPAKAISLIPLSASLTEALILAHTDMHSRFPVCREEQDPQTIEGYINFKDIVAALKINPSNPTLAGILRPIPRVSAETTLSKLLERMIQQREHIALVENPGGDVIGLITLEDVLEEMVGEIEDEYDRLPAYVKPRPGGWICGGGTRMRDFWLKLGKTPPQGDEGDGTATLAEWCEKSLGRGIRPGDRLHSSDLVILATRLRRNRLMESWVEKK